MVMMARKGTSIVRSVLGVTANLFAVLLDIRKYH